MTIDESTRIETIDGVVQKRLEQTCDTDDFDDLYLLQAEKANAIQQKENSAE